MTTYSYFYSSYCYIHLSNTDSIPAPFSVTKLVTLPFNCTKFPLHYTSPYASLNVPPGAYKPIVLEILNPILNEISSLISGEIYTGASLSHAVL